MDMSNEKSYPARYFSQMSALMTKDWILFRRNWKSSIILIFSPLFFVFLFGIFATLISQQATTALHPLPFATVSSTANPIPKCVVFDKVGGRYGLGQKIPRAPCTTLVYTPNSNVEVNKILQLAASKNGLSFSRSGGNADVIGFSDKSALFAFIQLPSQTGRIGAAIIFNDTVASKTNLPKDIRYDIWFNKSVVGHWMENAGEDEIFKKVIVALLVNLITMNDADVPPVRQECQVTLFEFSVRLRKPLSESEHRFSLPLL